MQPAPQPAIPRRPEETPIHVEQVLAQSPPPLQTDPEDTWDRMAPLKPEEIQAIRAKPVAERTHADQRRLHWAEDYWTNEDIQTETTAFYKLNSEVGAPTGHAKGAEKVAPKVLGRAGGAIGGAVIPDNEGRQTHDVQVGGQDLSFDHGPGDLYNPVYGKDPATGETLNTGMVAVPNGRDADGNPRFDLMPQSNLGKYLDGKMTRTEIADPMPPAPGLEPTPMPEGHGIETYPARQPEKDDGMIVDEPTPPVDTQTPGRPIHETQPEDTYVTMQGQGPDQILPNGKKGQEKWQSGYDEWYEAAGRRIEQEVAKDPINRKISPSESYVWKSLKPEKDGRRKDKDGNIYTWDHGGGGRHKQQIEKFDKKGEHLGAFDPITGRRVTPRDKEKWIKVFFLGQNGQKWYA
ncbi:colicin E3/pyocin S6 family cytotoxin [Magnetospira sp. QH-2]|uniref:colicin E3/pyocin S6 family cytotoxin n=1 Tax=Magnetospira sp. (strain QH-2) TaxID=1288970 RepID=UPI0003E81496|nr:colicin E3/pyocin S6 family cytotoxin [Magnetospira sp. QH-2]CCQ74788.1 protein of unknown function [Magnetospira sp. QH-2]